MSRRRRGASVSGVETLYGTLLVLALVLNGIAVAGVTPLRTLLAPVREFGLVVRILLLDLVLVPIVVVGTATLLDVDEVTRAALVIVSAASCGAIGIALARIAGGDVPLSVTLVVGLGALNVVTVPAITGLLLPASITIPIASLVSSLLGLALAPLLVGRLFGVLAQRTRMPEARFVATIGRIRSVGDLALLGAVISALLLDPRGVVAVLFGPVVVVALVTMVAVTVASRAVTRDPLRVRTLAITLNARAVGLALTLATLHLGAVPGLRATVLAYGGLTQLVPILVVLAMRRRVAGARRKRDAEQR
jgi:predicted Na+-dependent transporter